mmetsp:Transcript_32531/g.69787  ORF Transcript_32531/g.69787 Transcript_32531/m.69787 type:complete len:226 (-) Transcript_32531:901-1578(-)
MQLSMLGLLAPNRLLRLRERRGKRAQLVRPHVRRLLRAQLFDLRPALQFLRGSSRLRILQFLHLDDERIVQATQPALDARGRLFHPLCHLIHPLCPLTTAKRFLILQQGVDELIGGLVGSSAAAVARPRCRSCDAVLKQCGAQLNRRSLRHPHIVVNISSATLSPRRLACPQTRCCARPSLWRRIQRLLLFPRWPAGGAPCAWGAYVSRVRWLIHLRLVEEVVVA